MTIHPVKFIQLKIALADIKPEIWRRVIVSPEMTLHELHRIIQLMLEWWDYHLYEFTVGGKRYQEPLPEAEGEDATKTRLAKLRLSVGDKFTYVYDFGDDWQHTIEVEGFTNVHGADSPPYVIAGERRGPPEDCGGVDGFERFLNAIKDPTDPEHEEYRTWVGEDYHPDVFDLRTVRHAVALVSAWESRER